MLFPNREFNEKHRGNTGNIWKKIILLLTADFVIGIPVFIVIYFLGIQLWTPWFFLALCYVSFPFLAAYYMKKRGLLLYGSAVLGVSAALGIEFHSIVLFIIVYTICLLVGIYVAFTLSIRDDQV